MITLLLKDQVNVTMCIIDKNVLINKFEYFKAMLAKFAEKNQDEIVLNVPNSGVMFDILNLTTKNDFDTSIFEKSCDLEISKCDNSQKIPDWQYQLELIVNLDYLNIKCNARLINCPIPHQYFQNLIDVVETIGYNEDVIDVLIKNLPNDYDLRKTKVFDVISQQSVLIKKFAKNLPKNYDLRLIPTETLKQLHELTELLIASKNNDKIDVWNIDAKIVATFQHDNREISCIAFSNDNQMIAFGDLSGQVKIWHIRTAKLLITLYLKKYIVKIIFDENDETIVIPGSTIRLLAEHSFLVIQSSEEIYKYNLKTLEHNFICELQPSPGFIWSSDLSKFMCISWGDIICFDFTNGKSKRFSGGHRSSVATLELSCNDKLIVSRSYDGEIKIWTTDGILLKTLMTCKNSSLKLCFSPDNQMLVFCDGDKIKIWRVNDNKNSVDLISGIKNVTFLKFSMCSSKLIVWNNYPGVTIWCVRTGKQVYDFDKILSPKQVSMSYLSDLSKKIRQLIG